MEDYSKTKIVVLLICILFTLNNLIFVGESIGGSKPLTAVRFASVPAIVEAPSHVAYQKKYFQQEGLNLSIEINPDGKTSLTHLFEGKVDIAAVMGTPVVYSSFQRNDFYVIAKMEHAKIHSAIARKDSGININNDIKGKKVAVMFGTSGHFFLDSWLIFHNLKPSEIHLVNLNGPEAVDAIGRGDVDAMFYWFPFPDRAMREFDSKVFELPSSHHVPGSWVIVVKKNYAHKNPEILKQFLRAITKADEFIRKEPEAAMRIHSDVSGVAVSILSNKFKKMGFRLCLDQELILDFEDQARWIISYGYTTNKQVPNYLNYIYPDALLSVKPAAVTLIHGAINENSNTNYH